MQNFRCSLPWHISISTDYSNWTKRFLIECKKWCSKNFKTVVYITIQRIDFLIKLPAGPLVQFFYFNFALVNSVA